MDASHRSKSFELAVLQRLDYIAGLAALPPRAPESLKIKLAARVGLPAADLARILGKKPGAARKAIQRARHR